MNYITHNKLYFLICPKGLPDEKTDGVDSILSFQEFKKSESLSQIKEKKLDDGTTASYNDPIIAYNYNVEVNKVSAYSQTATVTITWNTKNGPVSKTFDLAKNSCQKYEDENFIILFGIGAFENANAKTEEENNEIIARNVERVKNLTKTKSIDLISSPNEKVKQNNKAPEEEPSV